MLDTFPGSPTVVGRRASDDIEIIGAPRLRKEFTDDPVPPGGTVTLQFTLTSDESVPGIATGIAFTDDLTTLTPAIPGLMAASVGPNSCAGSTVDVSAPTLIAFSGGTLAPGEICSFSVTLERADRSLYPDSTPTTARARPPRSPASR